MSTAMDYFAIDRRVAMVRRYIADGLTDADIAPLVGLTRSGVGTLRKNHGIPASTAWPVALERLTFDEQEQALCAQTSPDAFYPDKGEPHFVTAAKETCAKCQIRVRCLEVALANDERFGIWAGTTPRERRKLLRDREERAS